MAVARSSRLSRSRTQLAAPGCDTGVLLRYRDRAPGVRAALPSHEHFAPLFVALGAAGNREPVSFPNHGFWYGNSMRSVQFG